MIHNSFDNEAMLDLMAYGSCAVQEPKSRDNRLVDANLLHDKVFGEFIQPLIDVTFEILRKNKVVGTEHVKSLQRCREHLDRRDNN